MSSPTKTESVVPPEEVERRIAEYRRVGYEYRSPVHIVYHPPRHPCPWPGCDYRVAGIAFELEKMGDPAHRERWMRTWWQGPGLVGPCPKCGRLVLFGYFDKRAVTDMSGLEEAMLPRDWFRTAHVVPAKDV